MKLDGRCGRKHHLHWIKLKTLDTSSYNVIHVSEALLSFFDQFHIHHEAKSDKNYPKPKCKVKGDLIRAKRLRLTPPESPVRNRRVEVEGMNSSLYRNQSTAISSPLMRKRENFKNLGRMRLGKRRKGTCRKNRPRIKPVHRAHKKIRFPNKGRDTQWDAHSSSK